MIQQGAKGEMEMLYILFVGRIPTILYITL